ncbi:hypothetical protein PY479_00935 [Shewanella sp. A32]|uniref:hypothetical protein n=1 Tax=Shewanella sp. A32 TaxID=3031327 RepID=UPI0023B90E4F|nr:hypothetical protein [Shewanella sp. A32]MDF0532837.1 hypothetical protein [Shewanella sp. A32]
MRAKSHLFKEVNCLSYGAQQPMLMKFLMTLILLLWCITGVQAQSWDCQIDFESRCTPADGCSTFGAKGDDNTKPVSVAFDSAGNFDICIYSGCYQGQGAVLSTSPFLSITEADAEWVGVTPRRTNVFIVLDIKENIGMFKADVFAQPMTCQTVEK